MKKISESAVRRLFLYLRLLRNVAGKQGLILSQELAPDVADRLAKAGVSAILNLAPVEIGPNEETLVRTRDLELELQGLTFHAHLFPRRGALPHMKVAG